MTKHVNGRSISDPMNVKLKSHLSGTSDNLTDYVKQIACKKQNWWLYTQERRIYRMI